jgi:hypothetical protein
VDPSRATGPHLTRRPQAPKNPLRHKRKKHTDRATPRCAAVRRTILLWAVQVLPVRRTGSTDRGRSRKLGVAPSSAVTIVGNGRRSSQQVSIVSIYLPTPPETQNVTLNRMSFGNLTRTALEQLDAAGFNKRRRADLQEQLLALNEDDDFWRLQANGLAVFATPDSLRTFQLTTEVTKTVEVSDRFHLRPLMRAMAFPSMHSCWPCPRTMSDWLRSLPIILQKRSTCQTCLTARQWRRSCAIPSEAAGALGQNLVFCVGGWLIMTKANLDQHRIAHLVVRNLDVRRQHEKIEVMP